MDPKEKKTKQEEELKVDDIQDTVEGQSQNEEATEATEPLTAEEKLEKELKEAQAQIEDQKDKYLRLSAEFDNYRKRTVKEKAELILNGGEKSIKSILPVIDDMERALTTMETATDVNAVKEGVELIYNKFLSILSQDGVKVIETKDQPLDTDYHEAIAVIPAPTEEQKGKILDCVQTGYTLNGKVIRHAKVVVEVTKESTVEEIKKAYRKKAIQYHPDKNPGDKEAEEKFKEAAEAYDVLSNPDKRARYDQFGHAGMSGAAGNGGPFGGFSGGMSMDDIFSMFGDIFGGHSGGGFGGGFGGFGGFGGGGSQQRKFRGSDLRVKVKLNLKEISTGVEKKFKLKKYIPCSHCHGTGAEGNSGSETCPTCKGSGSVIRNQQTILGTMQTRTTCPTCNGEGKIIKDKCKVCGGEGIEYGEEVVTVKIPAGVAEGMQLSMGGKGNAGKHNGIPGDLLILVEEEPHPELIRDENDLVYNLLLSFPTAAIGGAVEIPTIDGKVKVKIEAGTQPGKVLRLRGKGLPSVNGYGTGDLLVNVSVYVPETLSKEEKSTLEKLEESKNFKPSTSIKEKIFKKFRSLFD